MSASNDKHLRTLWDMLGATPDVDVDLVAASTLVARDEYPELDPSACDVALRDHAALLHERLDTIKAPQARLATLSQYLFEEAGFSGNQDAFYDPRNSYLNDVLDRRLGIPLSLAVVQIELARRVDLPLQGVSFPGHFLVRLDVEDGLLVLDPYHRGRSIGADELRERASPHLGGADIDDRQLLLMLEPASNRAIVARMLRNLKNLYEEQKLPDKALRCADRLVRLVPGQADLLRDRADLYHRIGHEDAARADWSRYLALMPKAEDHDAIRERLIDTGTTARRLH